MLQWMVLVTDRWSMISCFQIWTQKCFGSKEMVLYVILSWKLIHWKKYFAITSFQEINNLIGPQDHDSTKIFIWDESSHWLMNQKQ